MISYNLKALAGAMLLLFLAACGTIEAGIEQTPTPDHSVAATVVSLQKENAQLATQVATLVPATPTATHNLGKVAYIDGGDIYVKSLPDGQAQRLTTDGHNSRPEWSPSGDWITFNKDTDVWLMRADGSLAHKIPVAYDYAWALKADRLAYVQHSDIYIIEGNALGQSDQAGEGNAIYKSPPATEAEFSTVGKVAWNPDGSQLAFILERGAPNGPLHYNGIWTVPAQVNSTAHEVFTLSTPPSDEFILAGWAPDGASILFWRDPLFSSSLMADGLQLFRISPNVPKPDQLPDAMLLHLDWLSAAPSGSQLARVTGSGRETWSNKRIEVMDLKANRSQYLTDSNTAALSPTFSPDGKQIVYISAPDAGNTGGGDAGQAASTQRHIWIMNADGSNKRQLTNEAGYRDERPLWSADGSTILFARLDDKGTASLWLILPEKGTPQKVVNELTPEPDAFGNYGYIDWSQFFAWWNGTTP